MTAERMKGMAEVGGGGVSGNDNRDKTERGDDEDGDKKPREQ